MKKIKIFSFILIICLICSGCGNYRELNYLAITTAISFDKKDNKYVVSYMLANPSKSQSDSKSQESMISVYHGEGNSISSAAVDLNNKLPKIPYISHLQVIVISEDIAKEGLLNVLDFFMRNPESRKEFYVVLSRDNKASDILKTLAPLESSPSDNISDNILYNKRQQSDIISLTYSELISNVLDTGINPIISGLSVEGDIKEGEKQESLEQSTPNAIINFNGAGIFKDDKLIGWIDNNMTTAFNIINNNSDTVLLETKCDDGHMASNLKSLKTETKINFEGNIPKIKLNIAGKAELEEITCKINLEDPNTFNELEKVLEEELKYKLTTSIDAIKKDYQTDIFGFGNMIYKNNFKKWKEIKNDWESKIFPNTDVDITIDINLINKGSFEQTLKELKNE